MELNSLEKKIFFQQAVSALLELEQDHLSTACMRISTVTFFCPVNPNQFTKKFF
jgi:hypothetical protein